jgi:hypothetical protein
MTPYAKRLIEVDLPIKKILAHPRWREAYIEFAGMLDDSVTLSPPRW